MNISVRRILFSQFVFWIALAGLFAYFLFPLRKHVRLGMDLAGGTYLTLQVQTEKAVEVEIVEKVQAIEKKLQQLQKIKVTSKSVEDTTAHVTFASSQIAQQAAQFIERELADYRVTVAQSVVKIEMPASMAQRIKKEAVAKDIDILRLRLNKIGVADIPIAAQGERNIVIELPDVLDAAQAKAMIGKAARLEFREVVQYGQSLDDVLEDFDGELPQGFEILPSKDGSISFLVSKYSDVTGKDLKEVRTVLSEEQAVSSRAGSYRSKAGVDPVVAFSLTRDGGERFKELTSKNMNKMLAIVLDGVVISAPQIRSVISSDGSITGQSSIEEAQELTLLLKSGSFAAPVTFEEERQVGPLLGQESIKQGFQACAVSLGLLLLFSLFYYSYSGFVAFATLLYNLLLILVGVSWFGATLTLPGIGGMILTIGMAIDASILIFERIKEELSHGSSAHDAIQTGFSGAMQVILDANITTFLIGIVLYTFGTGPIQGFAVTMSIGIVATLVTAILFQRSIFKFILDNFGIQKLKI